MKKKEKRLGRKNKKQAQLNELKKQKKGDQPQPPVDVCYYTDDEPMQRTGSW
jgi:hypothetical protein